MQALVWFELLFLQLVFLVLFEMEEEEEEGEGGVEGWMEEALCVWLVVAVLLELKVGV